MQPTASCHVPVLAAEDMTQGTCSDEFDADVLLRRRDEATTTTTTTTTTVEVSSSAGRLRAGGSVRGYSWVRTLPLADDCHSCNVLLHSRGSRLVLLVVRPVRRGEPLLLWLSEPLLALCAIPFLSPCNIQGEKRYVCHKCGRLFGVPNPLKIHLALSCDRLSISSLWGRLKDLGAAQAERRGQVDYSLLLSSEATRPPGLPRLEAGIGDLLAHCRYSEQQRFSLASGSIADSSSLSPRTLEGVKLQSRGGSAFRPYGKRPPEPEEETATTKSSVLALTCRVANAAGLLPTPQEMYNQQAAVMETLVSNLGRSRQGHLCIYCGKVYSRKYGLKIHIRTHTGYKPLNCKVCLRPFGDPSNLNKHVRLHTGGETPYKCEQCGKVLVRRRDLERHLRSRHSPSLAGAEATSHNATTGQPSATEQA